MANSFGPEKRTKKTFNTRRNKKYDFDVKLHKPFCTKAPKNACTNRCLRFHSFCNEVSNNSYNCWKKGSRRRSHERGVERRQHKRISGLSWCSNYTPAKSNLNYLCFIGEHGKCHVGGGANVMLMLVTEQI